MTSYQTAIGVVGLALLAFAGYLKGAPIISQFPIDLTIMGVLMAVYAIALQVRHRAWSSPDLFLFCAFILLVSIAAVPIAETTAYADRKTVLTVTLLPLSLLGGYILLQGEKDKRFWLRANVALGAALAVLTLVFPDVDSLASGRISLEGGNTTSTGRGIAAAAVILFINALYGRRGRPASALLGSILLLVALLTGARGPMLAALLATGAVAMFASRNGRLIRTTLVACGAWLAFYVAVVDGRISDRAFNLSGSSTELRFNLWESAISAAANNPFGVGWGMFYREVPPNHLLESGYRQYPHNVILEIAAEGGWALAGLTVIIVLVSLRRLHSSPPSVNTLAFAGLFIFFLVSAMVAGDVTDNRGLWVLLGASLAINLRSSRGPSSTTKNSR